MRALTLIGTVAIFAATAAGCAAISGLDQLQKVDCTDDCEGGIDEAGSDVTMVGDGHHDTGGDDAPDIDSTMGNDGSDASEAGNDGALDGGPEAMTDSSMDARDAPNDAPTDAPNDAPGDAPPDAAPDVVDGGCGPTNTITNCAACGNVCNTTTSNGSPACNGTKCLYGACNAGRADCNATAGADTDGCECNTPSCCAGNACANTHANGVGQNYYDCVAVDTYNQTQAIEACTAYTGNQTDCTMATCQGPDGGASGHVICSDGFATGNCVCWEYDAPFAGHLYNSMMLPGNMGANCFCPGSANSLLWH